MVKKAEEKQTMYSDGPMPKSKKIARDTVVSTISRKSPRKVEIKLPKEQLEPKEVWPYVGISIQSALRELGIEIDITIREKADCYEIIAEE